MERRNSRSGILRGAAALTLVLSFAAVEFHLAIHRPQAPAELGVEPHDHPSHRSQLETVPASLDRRCLVCLTSSQRRAPVCGLPAALPQPLAAGTADAGEYPPLAGFGVRRPVSRGPPLLL